MPSKDEPQDDLIGVTVAARYRIISRLGAGGMGTAYRAWDEERGVPVVIKIPKKIFLEDPKFAERFHREIRLLQGLTHPHIVPITDVGEHEGLPFVAMRYLPGGSLSNRRLRDDNGKVRPNPPGMLRLWLPAVAEALDFVHSQGVVHRDVKPANIFFDAFWGAYLGDFGIAKIVEESDTFDKEHTLTATHMGIGTQEYMCPEQFTPKAVIDGRADQYALAVMVYEMVAGTRPFTGATAHLIVEVTTQQPSPLQVHRRDLPPSLCEAVHRGLSKNPSERFVTCRDFAAAVLQHVQPLADEPGVARLLCPKCSNILKLQDEAAGRKGSCPKCNTQMQVADDLGALWLLDEARRQKKAGSDGERTEEAVGVILADEGVLDAFKPVSGTTPLEKAARRQKQRVTPVAIWGGLAAAVLAAVVIWGSMPGGKKPRTIPPPPTYEERLAEAEAKLKADPSDRAANETLGRHWCFKAQNWDKGLPYLSKSNAIGVASAAEKELEAKAASPENSGDLVRAAQGWWQVANLPATQKEEATAAVIKKHAAAIHTAAVDGLTVAKDVDYTNRWLDANPEFLALVGNKRPRAAEPFPAPELTNSVGMKLKLIPAGTFQMGANDGPPDGKPVYEVRITRPFYIGVYEVTNAQWKRVMGGEPPSRWKDDNRPVEQVRWDDVVNFCDKLSALPAEKAAGRVYRLPTEAEWEYACRAGTTTAYSYGDDEGILGDFAWFGANAGGQSHPVGQKKPNPWGLHDMHGNVLEWCRDRFGPYGAEGASDPTGPATGSVRVARGGCFVETARGCRSAARFGIARPDRYGSLGFRLALSPSGTNALASGTASKPSNVKDSQVTSGTSATTASPPQRPDDLTATKPEEILALPLLKNSIGVELKLIPAGTFTMGTVAGMHRREGPPHEVTLTKSFFIGAYEVTNDQWKKVIGEVRSEKKDPDLPVTHVNWSDAVAFCDALSAKAEEKALRLRYRLPTEAEWEYACRAGSTCHFCYGDDGTLLGGYAWFKGNTESGPHPVGKKSPNDWGLFDMHGNLMEWCSDYLSNSYYEESPKQDPRGPATGGYRVARGGHWGAEPQFCRSTHRIKLTHYHRWNILGFRVVAEKY
jgi:formylglycine-generating enzyme required for sulfatase activity